MFEFTKATLQKNIERFKRWDFYRSIVTQLIYIAYLSYALLVGIGVKIANAILLPLAVAYFLFYIIAYTRTVKKKIRKRVKRIFKRSKQLVKIFALGVLIYGIIASAYEVRPLSLFFTFMMAMGVLIQIIFELLFRFLKRKAKLFMQSLEQDFAPFASIKNLFIRNQNETVDNEIIDENDDDIIWNI